MSDDITNDDVIVSYMVMKTLNSVKKTCTIKTVYSRINNMTKAKLYVNKIHDLVIWIINKYIVYIYRNGPTTHLMKGLNSGLGEKYIIEKKRYRKNKVQLNFCVLKTDILNTVDMLKLITSLI